LAGYCVDNRFHNALIGPISATMRKAEKQESPPQAIRVVDR
jgi:hypothetical protein